MVIRDNQYFWLVSGKPIRSLKELKNSLPGLSKEEFSHHVNQSKNDFAVWVRDVFDTDLAQLLAQTNSQEEMVEVMNQEFENEEESDESSDDTKKENESLQPENQTKNAKSSGTTISDSLPQTFEEIADKKQSGPEDGKEYAGDEGMSYREKITDRFAESHKKMIDSLKHVVPESLQEKFELLEEQEKELRFEISQERKNGFDLYIADITLRQFRALLDMAKATEDTVDIKTIEKLFEKVREEINYAKDNPPINVKKEIEAMANQENSREATQ